MPEKITLGDKVTLSGDTVPADTDRVAARLRFLVETGAQVCWSRDGELCWLRWEYNPWDEEGGPVIQREHFFDPAEAIDAAIAQRNQPDKHRELPSGDPGPQQAASPMLRHSRTIKAREAEGFRKLRKLMGYVENGSDTTVRLWQDDATRTFHVLVGNRNYWGNSLLDALEKVPQEDL